MTGVRAPTASKGEAVSGPEVARGRSVFVVAVGCRVNQAEADGLHADFASRGFSEASTAAAADVLVVNTCSVTGSADTDGRKLVRRLHRANPAGRIVVTGCQAEREAEALAALPGVRLVVGNGGKARLAEWAQAFDDMPRARVERPVLTEVESFQPLVFDPRSSSVGRPLVKVQDGCDRSCTFCVIPGARGGSRSLDADAIVEQLARVVREGQAEAVLTGIDLGSWGYDLAPASTLAVLLDRIDRAHPEVRVRLSSLDPRDLTDELVERIARHRWICPHLHVSLQTGSPEVHRRMGRGRWPEGLEARIAALASARPDLALGLDVLTAFPGETERDHELTMDWIRAQPVTYLHVFPYSPRPGTAAFGWPLADDVGFDSPIAHDLARRRAKALRDLGVRLRLAFHQRHLGTDLDCVVERVQDGVARGTSANYVALRWPAACYSRVGSIARVRVRQATAEGCEGTAT